jgi:nitrite reductase (NO-forming)
VEISKPWRNLEMRNRNLLSNSPAKSYAKLLFLIMGYLVSGCNSSKIGGVEDAILTTAPEVPPPITRDYPSKVIVHLFTKEVTGRLADSTQYPFWTFNGSVPGPMIRVRVGDVVEVHLSNEPSDQMFHSIDFHGAIGPGGGATSSQTPPGHTSVFSFTALHPGLFAYHCATPPVSLHIANGMYGLLLVQPEEPLPPVEHEYYIMQSEFYTTGDLGSHGLEQFDLKKAIAEDPTYVVFNGSVGAVSGDHALQASVGDNIRLYIGNIGPNLISSFHVIGGLFDKVYPEANTSLIERNVQTTLIPAGGATIVELHAFVPGTFTFVDHSMFRMDDKGASGQLVVSGKADTAIYSGKTADEIYLGK